MCIVLPHISSFIIAKVGSIKPGDSSPSVGSSHLSGRPPTSKPEKWVAGCGALRSELLCRLKVRSTGASEGQPRKGDKMECCFLFDHKSALPQLGKDNPAGKILSRPVFLQGKSPSRASGRDIKIDAPDDAWDGHGVYWAHPHSFVPLHQKIWSSHLTSKHNFIILVSLYKIAFLLKWKCYSTHFRWKVVSPLLCLYLVIDRANAPQTGEGCQKLLKWCHQQGGGVNDKP